MESKSVSRKSVSRYTVLLGNKPRMLRESLESLLASQSDVDVELVEPDPVEILTAVERTGADAVVVTLPESGEDPGLADHLLFEYPDLLVIALSATEKRGFTYRLVVDRSPIEPLSPAGVLAAIRGREKTPDCPAAVWPAQADS
jgi:DNA-binding transcriptional LysR family regulator